MTTLNKLEQALTSAKGLQSDLKTFSLDTEDQQAQQMFNQLSTSLDNTVQLLQSRMDFVTSEEPQYLQESMGLQKQPQNNQNDASSSLTSNKDHHSLK